MKKKLSAFNFISLLIIVINVLPISCKKDKGEEPSTQVENTISVSLENSNVKAYQLVNLRITNLLLDRDTYELEMGSKKVKAVKTSFTTLSFMVPQDLSSGEYEIKFPFKANDLKIIVTAPAAIANPESIITSFLGNIDQKYSDAIKTANTDQEKKALEIAKDQQKDAQNRFNQASATDKQTAAQFLSANQQLFNDVNNVLSEIANTDFTISSSKGNAIALTIKGDYKLYLAQVAKLLLFVAAAPAGSTLVAVGAIALGVEIGLSMLTGERSYLLNKVKKAVTVFLDYTYFIGVTTVEKTIDQFDKNIFTGATTLATSETGILRGEPFNLKIRPTFHALQRSDANRPESASFVKPFIEAYDKAKAYYDLNFSKDLGQFPAFSNKEQKKTASKLSDWEIKLTKGAAITVTSPSGSPDNFSVVFNTTSKTNQELEFTINYQGQPASAPIATTLLYQRPPESLTIISGNNQTGENGKKLADPLKIKVVDIKNQVLDNVRVEWKIKSGNGTLSGSESLTNTSGIAQIEWTIGADGTQEVEAIVKRSDGTPITGSPVLFKLSPPTLTGAWEAIEIIEDSHNVFKNKTYLDEAGNPNCPGVTRKYKWSIENLILQIGEDKSMMINESNIESVGDWGPNCTVIPPKDTAKQREDRGTYSHDSNTINVKIGTTQLSWEVMSLTSSQLKLKVNSVSGEAKTYSLTGKGTVITFSRKISSI